MFKVHVCCYFCFIKEMKRKAGNVSNIEEFEDDDLYNSDEDDEDIGNSAENLKVFCVSATEYQKMRNIILDDGPPTVSIKSLKLWSVWYTMRAVKGRRVGGIKNQNKINQYPPLQYLF